MKKKLNKDETILSYLAGNFQEDLISGKIPKSKEILKLICESFPKELLLEYAFSVYGADESIEEALKDSSKLYEKYEMWVYLGATKEASKNFWLHFDNFLY